MGTVREGTKQREIINGKNNEVVSVAEVQLVAFKFTDSSGTADVALALCFGKDVEDGGLGVQVIQPSVLKELLTVPHKFVRNGIRRLVAAKESNGVPAELGDIPDMDEG